MVDKEITQLQVDVGVLKTQVATLTTLCDKMDKVIDRLAENQDKMVGEIYDDMNEKKKDTTEDIKDLHSRITTVDRNLTEKLESVEDKIMAEIKSLRKEMADRAEKEDAKIEKILEWKWTAAGGIIAVAWLLSYIKFDTIAKIFN